VGRELKRKLPRDEEDEAASKRPHLKEQKGVRTGDGATAANDAPTQKEAYQDATALSVTGGGASSGSEHTTGLATALTSTKECKDDDDKKGVRGMAQEPAGEQDTTKKRDLAVYPGSLSHSQRKITQVMRIEGPRMAPSGESGSPASLLQEIFAEEAKSDTGHAKVLRKHVMSRETKELEEQEKKR
jgi:hypothetical protein